MESNTKIFVSKIKQMKDKIKSVTVICNQGTSMTCVKSHEWEQNDIAEIKDESIEYEDSINFIFD